MTVIELFKTKSIDEIADVFANLHYDIPEGENYRNCNVSDQIDIDDTSYCPDDCDCGYYDWEEGLCMLYGNRKCPYDINRKAVWKKNFIDWLNESIQKEE